MRLRADEVLKLSEYLSVKSSQRIAKFVSSNLHVCHREDSDNQTLVRQIEKDEEQFLAGCENDGPEPTAALFKPVLIRTAFESLCREAERGRVSSGC
jgi:hypothetical protein